MRNSHKPRNGNTENGGRRNWSDLPASEWARITKIYERGTAKQFEAEARALGTNADVLGRQVRNYRLVEQKLKQSLMAKAIPESRSRVYDDYTTLETDDAILISDVEVPDHDPQVLRMALLTGMKHGIRKLILGGDIIATDQDALNSWMTVWADEHGKTYETTLLELKQLIRAMFAWFTEGIYAITGNHDERLARKTGGQVRIDMMLRGEPVTWSNYSYLYLHSPSRDEWTYLCHQYNYSKIPVRLAQDIWAVETAPDGSRRKMNVVITHTHLEQTGWSPDGEWRCISMGCGRDPKRTKYARQRATKYPKWNQSFLMIKGGYFYPLTVKGTDWQEFLGPELYDVLQNGGQECA
jgi:hypothetical protein